MSLGQLIDSGTELTCISTGFRFTEGPVWSASEDRFYFSDIHDDSRWSWSDREGVREVMRPTSRGNGMAYDLDGNLLVCEQSTSCLVRFGPDGAREVVASHYRGKTLNCPNDVVTRASGGGIYFTDPELGRMHEQVAGTWAPELGFKGVFRVARAGAEPELLVSEDEFDQPNGLCFSPDESLLYVIDSPRAHVKVWDVRPDGSLADGRVFFEGIGTGAHRSAPDGMKCDELGNVWIGGPDGVWVVDAGGRKLGLVPTREVVGSLTWGGADLRTLFLTTATSIHAITTRVAGARLPGNH